MSKQKKQIIITVSQKKNEKRGLAARWIDRSKPFLVTLCVSKSKKKEIGTHRHLLQTLGNNVGVQKRSLYCTDAKRHANGSLKYSICL